MFGTKLRTNINGADETIRRVTREKVIVRGNTTIRTTDSTTSFLPLIERFVRRQMVPHRILSIEIIAIAFDVEADAEMLEQ